MSDNIWLRRVLLPLWSIQALFCIVLLIIGIIDVILIDDATKYADVLGFTNAFRAATISASLLVAFTSLTILSDIIESIFLLYQNLNPVWNIVVETIKSIIWTCYLVLAIISTTQNGQSGFALFFALILFFTQLGLLIYGAIVVHRHRKGTLYRGQYSKASTGGAGSGYNYGYNAPPFEGSERRVSSHRYSNSQHLMQPNNARVASNPFHDTEAGAGIQEPSSYDSYRPHQQGSSYDDRPQQMYEMSPAFGRRPE